MTSREVLVAILAFGAAVLVLGCSSGGAGGSGGSSSPTINGAESTFGFTGDQLRELARTDNLLEAIKNVHMNCEARSNHSMTVSAGYSWEQIRDKTTTFSVYPPEPISVGSDPWDMNTPFTNDGIMDTAVRRGGAWRTSGAWRTTGDGDFIDPPPEGLWTYKVNVAPFAYADVGVTDPFDENGSIIVLLPAITLTTNAQDHVTQVDVQFYRFSKESSSFSLVTDLSMFRENTGHIGAGFADLTGTSTNGETTKEIGVGEEDMVWESARVYSRPPELWKLYSGVEDDSTYQVETIRVGYRTNSVDFGVESRPASGS